MSRAAARPAALGKSAIDIVQNRLDELEEKLTFSGDEWDEIWFGVLREDAPKAKADGRYVLSGRVREAVASVLKVADRRDDRAITASVWKRLLEKLNAVPVLGRKQVVLPKSARAALDAVLHEAKFMRDLVLEHHQWQTLLETVLPEHYLPPPLPPLPTLAEPGTSAKVDEMSKRESKQTCLWHFLDPSERPDYCAALCAMKWRKRKRRDRRATLAERIAAGEQPPPHWFQGMLRFDDEECLEFHDEVSRLLGKPAGREFNPAQVGCKKGVSKAEDDGRHKDAKKSHAG